MTTLTEERSVDQAAIANSLDNVIEEALEFADQLSRSFIGLCVNICKAKVLDKEQFVQLREKLGWNSQTANAYMKIGQWIADMNVSPSNLELLDINTIKTLCSLKYDEIWQALRSQRLTTIDVRAWISRLNKEIAAAKKEITVESTDSGFLEWSRNEYGVRVLHATIHQDAGNKIEELLRVFKEVSGGDFPRLINDMLRVYEESEDWMEIALASEDAYIQAYVQDDDRAYELRSQLRKLEKAIAEEEAGTLGFSKATMEKKLLLKELSLLGYVPYP